MPRYKTLPLSVVEKWEPLAEAEGVSDTAQGPGGFLPAYKRAGGDIDAMTEEWVQKRDGFVARHMAQIEEGNEPLWKDGLPTRRHLGLVMWAYSPTPDRLRSESPDGEKTVTSRHTGTMIAYHLPQELAASLALGSPGAEAADSLHITLAYIKPEVKADRETLEAAVIEATSGFDVLTGKVGGVGRFKGDRDVTFATVDVPHLERLRVRLIEALEARDIEVAHDHGFTPHITLMYSDPDEGVAVEADLPLDIKIDALAVSIAEERGDLIPMTKRGAAIQKTRRAVKAVRVRRASTLLRVKRAGAMRVRQAVCRVKFVADSCDLTKRTIVGYGATFEDASRADSHGDIFAPGAFLSSIQRHEAGTYKVKIKDAHGRSVGVVTRIEEDGVGLLFEGDVEKSEEGDAFLKKFCAGSYDSFSVGFLMTEAQALPETGGYIIYDADLREISGLGDPSNIYARLIEVKSMPRLKTNCGCGKKGAAFSQALQGAVQMLLDSAPDLDEEDIVTAVAVQSRVDDDVVEDLMAGDRDCPPAEVVQALISLGVLSEADIMTALAADGCVEVEAEADPDPDPEMEEKAAPPISSASEFITMAEALEAQAVRLRQMASDLDMAGDEMEEEKQSFEDDLKALQGLLQ